MRYEGDVYRPPSEARSLIIQVTIGCSHNKCTFCHMYTAKQFRIRKKEEIMACGDSDNDLQLLSAAGLPVAVGNATDTVKAVAKYISDDYDKDGVANAMDRFVFK